MYKNNCFEESIAKEQEEEEEDMMQNLGKFQTLSKKKNTLAQQKNPVIAKKLSFGKPVNLINSLWKTLFKNCRTKKFE